MFLFCTQLFYFILFSLFYPSLLLLSFILTGNWVSDEPQSLNLNPLKKWGGGSDIYRPIYKENIKREWKFESSWTRSQLRPCWRISTLTRTSLWGTRNGNNAAGCWGLSEEASVFVPHVFEFCLLTNRRRSLLPTHVWNTKLCMFCIIPTINGGSVLKSCNRWSTFLDLFNRLSTFAEVILLSSAGWIWIGIEESRNCFPRNTWEFSLRTWEE